VFVISPKLQSILDLLVSTIPGLTYEFTEEGVTIHVDDEGAKMMDRIRENDVPWLDELCVIIRYRRRQETK
jgi:hypothetical protein